MLCAMEFCRTWGRRHETLRIAPPLAHEVRSDAYVSAEAATSRWPRCNPADAALFLASAQNLVAELFREKIETPMIDEARVYAQLLI